MQIEQYINLYYYIVLFKLHLLFLPYYSKEKNKLIELKNELEKKYNINEKTITIDLSLPKAPSEIYNEVKETDIKVDYLINNAGLVDVVFSITVH